MGVIHRFLIVILIFFGAYKSLAQPDNFLFHEVKAGETKYGISRQYQLSIEDLERYNPEIKSGLRVGVNLLIPKSKDSVVLAEGDTAAVIHVVKAQQTLYSLSRDYGISIAQLKAANPQLKEGLKAGMRLRIPQDILKGGESDHKEGQFIYHQVKAKQTAYSLAKQYDLSLDSLYALNPEAEDGLLIGQELRIPRSKARRDSLLKQKASPNSKVDQLSDSATPTNTESQKQIVQVEGTPDDNNYFLYKVKTGDSFYALNQKFAVSREDLIALNPELKQGLKVEKYIIVPRVRAQKDVSWLDRLFNKVDESNTAAGTVSDQTQARKEGLNLDSLASAAMEEQLNKTPVFNKDTNLYDFEKTYRIALVMPFMGQQVKTPQDPRWNPAGMSEMALQFYLGFELALQELADRGMNIDLRIYDSEGRKGKVKQISGQLREWQPDLVMGAAYKENAEYLADALQLNNTPVVSPLSNAVEVKSRPNLIKMIPGNESRAACIAELLNGRFDSAHLVFAHCGTPLEQQMVQEVKARLNPRAKSFIDNVISCEELAQTATLRQKLSVNGTKAVVFLSEDPVFLSDMLAKLNSLSDTNIHLIGPPRVLRIPTLEVDYLNRLHFSTYEVRNTDYKDSTTMAVGKKFRENYGIDAGPFALQGYDAGSYFLDKLWGSGNFFMESLQAETSVKTSTGFRFEKSDQGGLENTYFFLSGIRNFELVRMPYLKGP